MPDRPWYEIKPAPTKAEQGPREDEAPDSGDKLREPDPIRDPAPVQSSPAATPSSTWGGADPNGQIGAAEEEAPAPLAAADLEPADQTAVSTEAAEEVKESLDEALNSLERMLDRQTELPLGSPSDQDTTSPADAALSEPETLPVLENVVIPGRGAMAANPAAASGLLTGLSPNTLFRQPMSDLEAEAPSEAALRRRIAARLASEIDIIVQSKLEASLERLYVDLRAQISDHIDIMLPEIIDEFVRHEARQDADELDDSE